MWRKCSSEPAPFQVLGMYTVGISWNGPKATSKVGQVASKSPRLRQAQLHPDAASTPSRRFA